MGGMGMPPMRGMEMPGFPSMPGMSIEEMSSMPPPTPSQTPREDYTVTSPPMSPPPEMNHKFSGAADYTAPAPNQTAEATVLLKVKDGDEYKLALNMQQYSPDDITIKLMGTSWSSRPRGMASSSGRSTSYRTTSTSTSCPLPSPPTGACDQGAQEVILRLSPLHTFATICNLILYLYF